MNLEPSTLLGCKELKEKRWGCDQKRGHRGPGVSHESCVGTLLIYCPTDGKKKTKSTD